MKLAKIIAVIMLLFFFGQAASAEDMQGERFQPVDDSMVVDTLTGLTWALQDNGKDIDWWDAKKFCTDFNAGGYTDWRLPDIQELASLHASGKSNKDGYSIAGPFRLSSCCMWSSYDTMGGAFIFDFKTGKKFPGAQPDTDQLRVLPVRGTSKIDLQKF